MRIRLTGALLVVVACGGPSAPAASVEPAKAQSPSAAPVASEAPTPAPTVALTREPDAPKAASTAKFKVTATMAMDGKIDDKDLAAEANAQIEKVSACAPILRKTDQGTGSLNLQITVAKDGSTKPQLQSPVPDDAKKCILDAVSKWKLSPKAGTGSAMVLLSIVE